MTTYVDSSGLVDEHRLIRLVVAQDFVDDVDPTLVVVIYISALALLGVILKPIILFCTIDFPFGCWTFLAWGRDISRSRATEGPQGDKVNDPRRVKIGPSDSPLPPTQKPGRSRKRIGLPMK